MSKIREILKKYLADVPMAQSDADKLIDDLSNLDNWISVSDKLPKTEGNYLVNRYDGHEKENFISIIEYHNKKWYEWDDYNSMDIEEFPTHWQSLPQPPKDK